LTAKGDGLVCNVLGEETYIIRIGRGARRVGGPSLTADFTTQQRTPCTEVVVVAAVTAAVVIAEKLPSRTNGVPVELSVVATVNKPNCDVDRPAADVTPRVNPNHIACTRPQHPLASSVGPVQRCLCKTGRFHARRSMMQPPWRTQTPPQQHHNNQPHASSLRTSSHRASPRNRPSTRISRNYAIYPLLSPHRWRI